MADRIQSRAEPSFVEPLVEESPDALIALSPEGVVLFWNRGAEATFGLSGREAKGRRIHDVLVSGAPWGVEPGLPRAGSVAPGTEPARRQSLGVLVEGASGIEGPWAIRRADGAEVLMEFSVSSIELAGQSVVLSIGRDVTERIHVQRNLMVADRMASVGMLAAGVAHEINNPLAAVTGNLELAARDIAALAGEPADPLALERLAAGLADAREAADRVRDIVRDLNVFSRAGDDGTGPVDVHRVLDSSLRLARNVIRNRAKVVREYGDVLPVLANESRLGQVFLNLLVNAAQAMPDGRLDVNEIRLRTHGEPGWVVVEVVDTGRGMSADVQQRLFRPFFTTKPAGVGTGLGLAICHQIVTAAHGTIGVHSELGRGTTFRVRLPTGGPSGSVSPHVATTKPTRLR